MNTVVLAVSQKWQNEQLVRDTLRKLHERNPEATLRIPDPAGGAAKDAREFADALGFSIEKWKANREWSKYPTEIRNGGMLSGIEWIPVRCQECGGGPHGEVIGPKADLLICFWSGTSDNVKDLLDRRLGSGQPVVVYREKWSKKRGRDPVFQGVERAVNLKRLRTKLAPWEPATLEKERAAA